MLDTRRPGGDHQRPGAGRLLLSAALAGLSMVLLLVALTRVSPAYLQATGGIGSDTVGAGLVVPLVAGLVTGALSLTLLLSLVLPPRRARRPRR